ncbi:MAG TPA: BACON domain-containing carbohydrate-binding protein [Candidatus Sulfopaludibacter sp.]|jgi:uncharacterized protein (TIGR03437 family)|nr:BACON domain-containing carbohydrate-binding protein [Candidatus Sulfopaludibacter sp.]
MIKFLLLWVAAAPLLAQTTCSYSIAANGVVLASSATDTTNPTKFTVTTQSVCSFAVSTAATWIHLAAPPKGTSYTGTSTVSFTVDQNAGSQVRQDVIAIYGAAAQGGSPTLVIAVTQVAAICNSSVSPTSVNLPVGGGPGTLAITSGCAWGVTASSFLSLTAPNGTVGTAPLNYQASPNTCVAGRVGQMNLSFTGGGLLVVPVTQDGSTSNLMLSSNTVNATAGGLSAQQISVFTGPLCGWASYTDSGNWLHVNGGATGTGPGTYVYSVDANVGGPRTGHVYFQSGLDSKGAPIIATTLTVTQQGVQVPQPQVSAVLNGASFVIGPASPAPISPGEIVALFGVNMGPLAGVANTQTFGTSLGGVTVLFGSTPAPLIYVSALQINAVVPYAVAGSTSAAVTVQYAGLTSAPLTLPVQPATPGIFSYDRSGAGPGAILNQDYQVNEQARPAAVGSVVAIYCTGAGVTVPGSQDGALTSVTPPFPSLAAQPVTVTVGGLAAQVVYQGPAPGAIAGLTQIDIVVPNAKGGATGTVAVPVVVSIAGAASQANLTLAVQ